MKYFIFIAIAVVVCATVHGWPNSQLVEEVENKSNVIEHVDRDRRSVHLNSLDSENSNVGGQLRRRRPSWGRPDKPGSNSKRRRRPNRRPPPQSRPFKQPSDQQPGILQTLLGLFSS
ncbi:unnamed protein product [Ceutorhynchus assimilis]|uniref:Uncharacterized protein n=1 Tax=Ceutorhynchus assimilis TaxID=467358 RepID=A0A9N9N2F3_9CUCU|nr:unnamed protein product [Ceutorhynchus assimilis]